MTFPSVRMHRSNASVRELCTQIREVRRPRQRSRHQNVPSRCPYVRRCPRALLRRPRTRCLEAPLAHPTNKVRRRRVHIAAIAYVQESIAQRGSRLRGARLQASTREVHHRQKALALVRWRDTAVYAPSCERESFSVSPPTPLSCSH